MSALENVAVQAQPHQGRGSRRAMVEVLIYSMPDRDVQVDNILHEIHIVPG